MSRKTQLSNLPAELLLQVAGFLNTQDLSSLSRTSHQFHWKFFQLLFDFAITELSDPEHPEQCLTDLLFHAIKHDSTNIAQYLIYTPHQFDLNQPIRARSLCSPKQRTRRNAVRESNTIWRHYFHLLPLDFTFLHLALLADAPKVAASLMKNGANISQEVEDYPDLTPLYLALPRSLASTSKELDSALRIACSYSLPRTTGFLLKRGANANMTNKYGIAAIHSAVMRRRPWREFRIIDYLLSVEFDEHVSHWNLMLLQTVSTLLDFGADTNLRSQASRTHECDPQCWLSIDCDHQGQNPLHLASATTKIDIVSCLLDAGANPNLPNGQGYTALYVAIVQGHKDIACRILKACDNPLNPVVYVPDKTTALHIACRFSFSEMVEELLNGGAYANVVDSHGRTPLHDVLEWARPEREEAVVQTLNHLAEFGADPDIYTHHQTPRQLAETHVSARVRDMFLAIQETAEVRHARYRTLSTYHLNIPNDGGADVCNSTAQCDFYDPFRSDSEKEDLYFLLKPFPRHAQPKKDRVDFKLETAVSQEQFPELTPKPILNQTTALAANVRSETKTTQLLQGLKTPTSSPWSAPQSRKPIEEFPALNSTSGKHANKAPSCIVNVEATQFWGGLQGRISGAENQAATESDKSLGGLGAKRGGTKTGRGRNAKRWAPLRL